MSHQSREKRRKKKIAIRTAKTKNAARISTRYFLTIVTRETQCRSCGARLRLHADFVYCRNNSVCLCTGCADRDPLISYRPSLRWERARRKNRRPR